MPEKTMTVAEKLALIERLAKEVADELAGTGGVKADTAPAEPPPSKGDPPPLP